MSVNSVTNKIYAKSSNGITVIDGKTDSVVIEIPIKIPGAAYSTGEIALNTKTNTIYSIDATHY